MDGYLIREDDLRAELEPDYALTTDNKTEVVGACFTDTSPRAGSASKPGGGWWTGCTGERPSP